MELDWHADRAVSLELLQIDTHGHDIDIDMEQVRRYRLDRVRSQMIEYGIDAVILSDPVNIRYASGTRNMQVFSSRNQPARYLLVTPQRTILHEFAGCMHLANGFETIDEVRPALTASYVTGGDDNADPMNRPPCGDPASGAGWADDLDF